MSTHAEPITPNLLIAPVSHRLDEHVSIRKNHDISPKQKDRNLNVFVYTSLFRTPEKARIRNLFRLRSTYPLSSIRLLTYANAPLWGRAAQLLASPIPLARTPCAKRLATGLGALESIWPSSKIS